MTRNKWVNSSSKSIVSSSITYQCSLSSVLSELLISLIHCLAILTQWCIQCAAMTSHTISKHEYEDEIVIQWGKVVLVEQIFSPTCCYCCCCWSVVVCCCCSRLTRTLPSTCCTSPDPLYSPTYWPSWWPPWSRLTCSARWAPHAGSSGSGRASGPGCADASTSSPRPWINTE